jgi:hypothetical protein
VASSIWVALLLEVSTYTYTFFSGQGPLPVLFNVASRATRISSILVGHGEIKSIATVNRMHCLVVSSKSLEF